VRLTAAAEVRRGVPPPSVYTLRFGILENPADPADSTNLRTIDRIVTNPDWPDLTMAHFTAPVPDSTWTPRLTGREPPREASATVYGWGRSDGRVLDRLNTTVLDPAAAENAADLRSVDPDFAATFPNSVPPMTVNAAVTFGDSGGGVFSPLGILAGVITRIHDFQRHDAAGNLYGPIYRISYQQPVWTEPPLRAERSGGCRWGRRPRRRP
jgi:hypothetical protein